MPCHFYNVPLLRVPIASQSKRQQEKEARFMRRDLKGLHLKSKKCELSATVCGNNQERNPQYYFMQIMVHAAHACMLQSVCYSFLFE